ncbi:MAG: hemolysin III family protein [Rhodospirillaceae bacterium]
MSETPRPPPAFPRYTRSERVADGLVHGLGLLLAAAALPWLLWTGLGHSGGAVRLSLVLYALGAALMLGCSAIYNRLKEPRRKALFRRFDRAAIFIMIAGTYSPLALAGLDRPTGAGLMAFEWGLAGIGAALAIGFPRRAERLLMLFYLVMGWAILAVLPSLLAAVGATVVGLFLAGGLIYTAGVGLHASVGLKFHNVLWHGCVLSAAGCHYVAILLAVAGARS